MRRITSLAVSFGLFAALAGAQAVPATPPAPRVAPALPPTPPAPPAHSQFTLKLDELGPALRGLDHLKDLDLTAMALDGRMMDLDAALADAGEDLQDPKAVVVRDGQKVRIISGDSDYVRGTTFLDSGRYDRAIEAFDKVIAAN